MSRLRSALLAIVLALAAVPAAFALQPDERLADPALEARAREISAEVRCMVCQNQSIDDSDAELARDLRVLIRERLTAGDSNAEVLDFLVDRYGEFVLLKPRLNAGTAVLWLAAPALLAAAALAAFLAWRRRRAVPPEPSALTAAEEARLAALMAGEDEGRPGRGG